MLLRLLLLLLEPVIITTCRTRRACGLCDILDAFLSLYLMKVLGWAYGRCTEGNTAGVQNQGWESGGLAVCVEMH